jgi:hypothetical protein
MLAIPGDCWVRFGARCVEGKVGGVRKQWGGEGIQVWARVIVPLGLTPEEGDALVAAERDKLPAGTGIIELRIIWDAGLG